MPDLLDQVEGVAPFDVVGGRGEDAIDVRREEEDLHGVDLVELH